MPEAEIAKAVQLLDLMLEFFADDGHCLAGKIDGMWWTKTGFAGLVTSMSEVPFCSIWPVSGFVADPRLSAT